MLDAGSDHMIAGLDQSRDRKIVALGSAASEDDLRCFAAEQLRHRFACVLDGGACLLPVAVDGRGVAEALQKVWAHRLEDLRQYGRGGVVVEVNAVHIEPGSILRWGLVWFGGLQDRSYRPQEDSAGLCPARRPRAAARHQH